MGDNRLKDFVDRIVDLEMHKFDAQIGINAVFAEAAAENYNKPALRAIVKEHLMDWHTFERHIKTRKLIDEYRTALGMLLDTPLGEAAIRNRPSLASRATAQQERTTG